MKNTLLSGFLILEIKTSSQLLELEELLLDIKKGPFHYKTLVITYREVDDNSYYKIGLITTNASKNTFRSESKKMFSFLKKEDITVLAKKGMGAWAHALCAENWEIIHCSGEIEKPQLFQISERSRAKKSLTMKEKKQKKKIQNSAKKDYRIIHIILSFFKLIWNATKSGFKTALHYFIKLIVGFLFALYVFKYKDGGSLTPELLWHLSLKDIFFWLLDWQNPGIPPEWKKKTASSLTKVCELIQKFAYFVSWFASFISNLTKVWEQTHRLYRRIRDFFP